MIVVDVETTGTEPAKHAFISIGAVDFSDPGRQFYGECCIWEGAHIMDEALAVNGYTREEVVDSSKKSEGELLREFIVWMNGSIDHTIAGQNPFFDTGFLQWGAYRNHIDFSAARRIVDLHSIVYFHMIRRGIPVPVKNNRTDINSDTIMNYVGIPAEPKPHVALNGAKWEAEAFSRLFYEGGLFNEFKQYPIPWLV
jgi:DNA polymerase III epsilon subunit-like protein